MTCNVDVPAAGGFFVGTDDAGGFFVGTDDAGGFFVGTDDAGSGMQSRHSFKIDTVLRNACVHLHVVYRSTFKKISSQLKCVPSVLCLFAGGGATPPVVRVVSLDVDDAVADDAAIAC